MKSHATRSLRKLAVSGAVALAVIAIQYVVVSNVTIVSVAPTTLHSLTPLHGWAQRLASRSSVVVLEPMRSIVVRSAATCGAGLSGSITGWVLRFRSTVANDFSFAVANGSLWLAAIFIAHRAARQLRGRQPLDGTSSP